jgi:hypothetical protein
MGPTYPDYYDLHYLPPNGEGGKHAAYGGWFRDRPMKRGPLTQATYQMEDAKTEIRQGIAAGLDGFALNSTSYSDIGRSLNIVTAADQVDPNFKIMLMVDADIMAGASDTLVAGGLATLAKAKSVYRLNDGRVVLSTFRAESKPPQFWQSVMNMLDKNYGIKTVFLPVYLEIGKAGPYNGFSYGEGNWGDRSPHADIVSRFTAFANSARAKGKIWFHPVSFQDTRPYANGFFEARNSENLRVTWDAAVASKAELVQIATWSDYAENSHIQPSEAHGWNVLDLNAYYMINYKLGSFPEIKRDAVFFVHRQTPLNANPTGGQTLRMQSKGVTPTDNVEIITFLTAPSTIEVKIGNNTYSYTAQKGVFYKTYPVSVGQVSAKVVRTNKLFKSHKPIVSALINQNLNYIVSNGLRNN